jgi:hypothetical protein
MKKLVYGIILIIIVAISFFVVHEISKNNKENKENKEDIIEKKDDDENVINDIDFIKKLNYLKNNKDNLVNVVGRHVTLGDTVCYQLDSIKAYNLFTGIKEVTISNTSMTDNYYTYIFTFNDEANVRFSFSGPYYEEGTKSYNLIDFKHLSYEETDIIPC